MSACQLSRPPLFNSNKERLVLLGVFIFTFFIHLLFDYNKYLEFSKFDDYICDVQVQNHYIKNSRSVLKLKANDFTFYTKASANLRSLQGAKISVRIFNSDVTFLDYIKGFYAPSHLLGLYPENSYRSKIANKINTQHDDELFSSLFNTLFLALPASSDLREVLTTFSISHLVALSGFHLGLLALIIHFILVPLYKFFQQRFFPWRSRNVDITYISIALLFVYVVFTDFPPSLLRAFTMMVIGWFIYDRGLEVFSFENLIVTVLILFALSPSLIFSIGLWFSVAGVFYILIFLKSFQNLNKIIFFVLLHFWIFIVMLPIIHYVFDTFTVFQLLSPLLSMLFIIFYPIEMLLHIFSLGGLLDTTISSLFSLETKVYLIGVPYWFLIIYLLSSLAAIRYKFFVYLTFLMALSIFAIFK